jgi:hypothetical protein
VFDLNEEELPLPTWDKIGQDLVGSVAGDRFGYSVAISQDGQRVAIGALGPETLGTLATETPGYVRVLELEVIPEAKWSQVGEDTGGEANGNSVALSSQGTTVVIGANLNNSDSGNARAFVAGLGASTWTQIGGNIAGVAGGDQFGTSVAITGNGMRVAIGAIGTDGNGDRSGQVRVFDLTGSNEDETWSQIGQNIDGDANRDRSGISVALSNEGTRLAIGAIGATRRDFDQNVNSGQVRVFDIDSNDDPMWTQIGDDIDGVAARDGAGISVALSLDGSRLAIGAPFNDGENGANAGQVRVFDEVVRSVFLICLYTEPPSEHALISPLFSPASFLDNPQ